MWELTRAMLRRGRTGTIGTAVVLALAAALTSMTGVLVESGIRGGAAPDRYTAAPVVLAAEQAGSVLDQDTGTDLAPMDAQVVDRVRSVAGVADATGDLTTALDAADGSPLAAHPWESAELLGTTLAAGSAPAAGEVAVDPALDLAVGDQVTWSQGGRSLDYRVAGIVDRTAGESRDPEVYLPAATLAEDGLWLRTGQVQAVLVTAEDGLSAEDLADRLTAALSDLPDLRVTTGDARGDIEHPHAAAAGGMLVALGSSFAGIALLLVLFITAATLSLTVHQRRRELALLRTVGVTGAQLRALIVQEVAVLAAVAVTAGAVLGAALAPALHGPLVAAGVLTEDFRLVRSPLPAVLAAVLVGGTALLAALITARRPARMSAMDALRDADTDARGIGRGRLVGALVCAALGLLAATSPLFLGGLMGASGAATAAIVLLVAVGLAGPAVFSWLVHRVAPLVSGPVDRPRSAARLLATASCLAGARRLSTAAVPLAMALALGCVQVGSSATLADAATRQVRDAVAADAVLVTTPTGLADSVVTDLATLDGAAATAPLTRAEAHLTMTDAELGEPVHEPVTAVGIDPQAPADLLDPALTTGDPTLLAGPGTVSVSTDLRAELALEGSGGIGSTLSVSWPDGSSEDLTVVAHHDTGLGLGDLLVDHRALLDRTVDRRTEAVLVAPAPGATDQLLAATASLGLAAHPDAAVALGADSDGQDPVSLAAMGMLLAFVALGAINSLVVSTSDRRRELATLQVVGATARDIRRALRLEVLLVATIAVLLGTVTVALPLMGMAYGLSGQPVPALDWRVWAGLAALVTLATGGAVLGPARGLLRRPATAPSS